MYRAIKSANKGNLTYFPISNTAVHFSCLTAIVKIREYSVTSNVESVHLFLIPQMVLVKLGTLYSEYRPLCLIVSKIQLRIIN